MPRSVSIGGFRLPKCCCDFACTAPVPRPRDNTCGAMFATEGRGDERTHERASALAGAWAFPCGEAQVAALSSYVDLLLRWNARINLTAARSVELGVAPHLPHRLDTASR